MKSISKFKSEWKHLLAFGVIGFASLFLNLGVYALFSRVLWPNGPKTVEYALTVILVTLFNFEANRLLTFGAARSWRSAGRFALVALVALLLNNLLFWLGHAVLRFYDLYVIVANTFIVAAVTFTGHRLFTFHSNPWRFMKSRSIDELVNR